MFRSAHVDTFARDHLPPPDQWPDFLLERAELRYPERLNCAVELLDATVAAGHGERVVLRTDDAYCVVPENSITH
jgi:2-aminobenzoate-CoA ligase